ncbi:MAG TPA: hypothetical protein VIM16_18150 [Mucilaginibacter sp.]|jgi:hypothetical protein
MRTLILTIAAFVVFGISSCKKERQHPSQSIMGKWRWVKSVGGIGGFTLTPQSIGNNFRDEFYPDSTYKRFENNTLLIQGDFSIVKNYKYTPSEIVDVLKIGPSSKSIFISNDTLYMGDLFISDGYGDTYVRIK